MLYDHFNHTAMLPSHRLKEQTTFAWLEVDKWTTPPMSPDLMWCPTTNVGVPLE